MNQPIAVLIVCLVSAVGQAMGAGPEPFVLADFEEPEVLDRMTVTKSASVSLSDRDVVTGQRCLEVRVGPFSKHGDQWPYVFLIDQYFKTPLDLTRYSRVVATVRNVTEGLASIHFTLSSQPYNDGGRNLEGQYFAVPGGTALEVSLPTTLFVRPMNDPSSVQALMFVFPPNERDAVYRIDSIRAVYDPAVGSPAERLAAELASGTADLQQQIAALGTRVNWQAVPAERAAALRARIPELQAEVLRLQERTAAAAQEGWKGTYNASRDAVGALTRSLGEFVVADKTGFYLWGRSRYSYVRRKALPSFASPAVERLDLQMAGNEFRDLSFMVTAVDRDIDLSASVVAEPTGLAESVQLRWSEFVTPPGQEEYADLLVPLTGSLRIPRAESRELWATFDTRWHTVRPGQYNLRLVLRDTGSGMGCDVPISLRVWDCALPSYDVLPNNAYVEYHNSEIAAQVPEEGVRHMKMYGVNMTYVLPHELPWPASVDAQGNLAGFDGAQLRERITKMLATWQASPGTERLRWVFSLSGAPEHMMADTSLVFLSDSWNRVFAQWLAHFRELVKAAGVADEDWMLVLADESSESKLAAYEIPFAEMIKRLDPKLAITCNASQVISDAGMAERYFRVFDSLQPSLDLLKQSSALREFVGVNQRPLWTYRCSDLAGLDKDLYSYYRVYAWDNLRYGIVGTGIWTYCAQGDGAWSQTKRSLSYNLVFKARDSHELLHSRRYEFYREGLDDYRYVQALLAAGRGKGAEAEREARELVVQAIADITADTNDVTRCDRWRRQIAERILALRR